MKKLTVLAGLLLNILQVSAQNIGVNNPAPHASALWDMVATDKGILIPRMSAVQRAAIAAPATGLLVYDLTVNKFMYYDGTAWQQIGGAVNAWGLSGNTGNTAANFIGTTDDQPLRLKINNVSCGYIDNVDGAFTGRCVFLGLRAGLNNTASGYDNVYVGYKSGTSNTDGEFNTGLGSFTLQNSANAYSNTAIGAYAMQNAVSSIQSTAVGTGALTTTSSGNYNQAMGYHAMFATTNAGTSNNAMGYEALLNNTGSNNCAVGNWALKQNTSGSSNCAFGLSALLNNTIGVSNIAIGESALMSNTLGNYNLAIGQQSGQTNTLGTNNTSVGAFSLQNNTSGSNVAIGYQSGALRASYLGCTMIGVSADMSVNLLNNATAIGYNAVATASNQVKIGNAFVTAIGGAVNWSVISDGRFKKDVQENIPGLQFINALRPVSYSYDLQKYNRQILPEANTDSAYAFCNGAEKEKVRYSGFIAQEVEAAAMAIGYAFSGVVTPQNETDTYSIRYAEFVVPLVKAVQELSVENNSLKAANTALEQQLAAINLRLALLEQSTLNSVTVNH